VAELLGGPKVLPRVEVDKLIEARDRYGIKTPAGGAGGPLAAEDSGKSRLEAIRAELVALIDEALRARGVS
jgi:L-fuculose-phosphate aldolase